MADQPLQNNLDIRKAEFRSDVASALRQGGQPDFALLLAMMQQDITQRLQLQEEEEEKKPVGLIPIEQFNFYPEVPLSAEAQHYDAQNVFANAISHNDLHTAHLWACMHPTPLSIYNDVKRLPDEVIANCDVHTQVKLKTEKQEVVPVEPEKMYEHITQVREMGLDAA